MHSESQIICPFLHPVLFMKHFLHLLLTSSLLIHTVYSKPDIKKNKENNHSIPPLKPLSLKTYRTFMPNVRTPRSVDPVLFRMKSDKKEVKVGEEIELTITAHLTEIPSAAFFTFEHQKEFSIKVVMPEGFIQTGGNYTDYIGETLSSQKYTVKYTLRGYFTQLTDSPVFTLLRGAKNTGPNSIFEKKSELSIPLLSSETIASNNQNARLADITIVPPVCGTTISTSYSVQNCSITAYFDSAVEGVNVKVSLYEAQENDDVCYDTWDDIEGALQHPYLTLVGSTQQNSTGSFTFTDVSNTKKYKIVFEYENCTSGNTKIILPNDCSFINVSSFNEPFLNPPLSLCGGGSITLTATGADANEMIWYNSSGAIVQMGGLSYTPTFSNMGGTYTFYAQRKIGNCYSPYNLTTVTVTASPPAPSITSSDINITCGRGVTLTATGCAGNVIWSTGNRGTSLTVYPKSATTYTAVCEATSSPGCISANSNEIYINVDPIPSPTITASTGICNGASITLNSSGCGDIAIWSTGAIGSNITVSPSSTTTYSVTCPAASGCTAPTAVTSTIIVTTIASPTLTSNATNNIVGSGQPVTILVSGCSGTVTWSDNQTNTSRTFNPTSRTTYSATCTVGGCISSAGNITIDICNANPNWTQQSSICIGTVKRITYVDTDPCSASYNTTRNEDIACGCSPSQTPVPSGTATICRGGSTGLTASGCSAEQTYVWSNGATGSLISVNPSATTSYSVKCQKDNCDGSTSSTSVTVTVNSLPDAPSVTPSLTTIQVGQSALFTASGCEDGTVTWNTGVTGTTLTVTPSSVGTYSYSAVCSKSGCTSAASNAGTLNVNVNCDALNITLTAQPNTPVCPGNNVVLTLNNCSGQIKWSNGAVVSSITVNPTATISYTATCIGATTCSKEITVQVKTNQTQVTASNNAVCGGTSANLSATSSNGGTYSWSGPNNFSSPLQNPSINYPGTYTLTVTYNGCPYTASTTVNFTPPNSPQIIATPKIICYGQSTTLVASGCESNATVLWTNTTTGNSAGTGNSITVSPVVTTNYVARCQRSASCISPNSQTLTVTLDDFVVNASKRTICSGESVKLTASCCEGTVLWSTGGQGTSITVTPTTTTAYYATCRKSGDAGGVISNTEPVGVIGPFSYDGEPLTECTNDLKSNIKVKLKGDLAALTVQYKVEKWVSGAFTLSTDWTANESVLQNLVDGRYRLTVRGVDNPESPLGECQLASKELFLKCDCGFSATAVPNPVVLGDAIILAVDGMPFNSGKALSFTDNNHTFEPSFNLGSVSNTFTWEAWVMPNAALTNNNNDDHYLLFPVQGGNGTLGNDVGLGIAVGTNGVRLVEHGSNYLPQILRFDTPLSSSTWNHIAIVYNNKVPTIYINGIAKASNPSNATTTKNIHPTAHIGGAHWGYDLGRYIGKVDEVRVWSTARTGAQILADFEKILSGQEPNLVAYWRFEEITNNQVKPSPAQGRYANLGGTYQLVDGNNNDPGSLNVTFSWTNPDGFSAAGPVVVAYPDHDITYTVSRSDATCKANIPVKVLPEPCELSISATNTNLLPGESSVLTVGNGSYNGGKGLRFDGGSSTSLNQNFNFGDLHTNFTWEAWVLPEQTVTGNVYSNRYALYPDWGGGSNNAANAGMGIAVGTNGVQLAEHTDNYMPLVLNHSATLSGWTHIAVVYQNNKPALYINGQPSPSNAAAPTSSKLVHPSATLGGDYYGHFAGKIDEVRVWNKARTQAEIETDYRKILTGFEANLRAYFRFETINGNQTSAMIPAGGTANLNGGVSVTDGFTAPKPATPANQYAWSTGDGTALAIGTQITVTPAQNTTYSVVCTNCTGCNTPTKDIQVIGSLNACYTIKPKNSNKPIYADYSTGNVNGVAVKQRTLNGMDAQIWQFTPAATVGYVKIINAEDTRVIESSGGSIRMWVERTAYNQAWKIIRNTDNSYRISPQNDLTVSFDVSGNSQSDGAQIQLSSNHTSDNQKYFIEPTTCPYNPPVDQQCTATGYITYERWNNINGTSVNDLKNSTKFTQVADVNELRSSFEAPQDIADNYGARMRGYICPPANGQYTFYVAADDNTELWLSTDDNPANKVKIAYHNSWSSPRQYQQYSEQKSQLITLKKGTKYYIEALVKDGSGGDNLSVSWQIPGRSWNQLPISGQYLSPFSTCSFNVVQEPDKTEFLSGTVVKLKAVRAGSLATSDIFNWEHKTLKHFVSSLTAVDSTRTRTADSVYVKPLYTGIYTYTVSVQGKPTCFKDIKLTIKDILCGCDDCTTNDRVKNTDNPPVNSSNLGSGNQNYIIENNHLNQTGSSVVQNITYLDGLGRPIQKIAVATGGHDIHAPVSSDIVSYMEYDAFGREIKKYLPYAPPTDMASKGKFLGENLSSFINTFYSSTLQKQGNAYSQIEFEPSPLNRILSQTAPGPDNTPVQITYRTNTSGEVKLLTYNYDDKTVTVSDYASNQLSVVEIKNEKDQITIEYKDKEGRIVCTNVAGRKTYYCYDYFGWLRCVIPPLASQSLTGSILPFNNELLFAYDYDTRGRLIKKKVPSSGAVLMEYNERDLIKKVTDPNGKITQTEYDGLNRVKKTTDGDGNLLTENFYDTYPNGALAFKAAEAFGQSARTSLQGLPTGSRTSVLNPTTDIIKTTLMSNSYYDELGRVIQTAAENHKGGTDYSSSKLDFSGRVLENKLSTQNNLRIETRTAYDVGGRVKSICQRIDESYWEPVSRHSYNAIGELDEKILGCYLQRLSYTYEMRGWLTKINNPDQLWNNFADKDFFGMSLKYDKVGNIIEWNWRTSKRKGTNNDLFDIEVRDPYTQDFRYDELNRLKFAELKKNGASIFKLYGPPGTGDEITYDDNGNITAMNRSFNGSPVDQLVYNYKIVNASNQLVSVTDGGNNGVNSNFFKDGVANYSYDPNGNLITDSGKGIDKVEYNYLNLPEKVTFSGKEVNYTYTGSGQKLLAVFPNGKKNHYIAGLVYDQDGLEFIPTSEGRILPPQRAVNPTDGVKNNFYRFEYQLKDHLGNLRLACRCAEKQGATRPEEAFAPIVVQENHPDAWGLTLPLYPASEKINGSPVDRFTFTDKEKQRETGWFDFGARMYNAEIGRWWAIDPLSGIKTQLSFTPYHYAYNNPILFNDPLGLCPECESLYKNPHSGQVHISSGGEIYLFDGKNWTREGGYLQTVEVKPKAQDSELENNDDKNFRVASGALIGPKTGIKQFNPLWLLVWGIVNTYSDVSPAELNPRRKLPVYFVPADLTPEIYVNTIEGILETGHEILNYGAFTEAEKSQKRREAYGNLGPADPTGQRRYQWDEYPYASTFQGGKKAHIMRVRAIENRIQGILLNKFYRTYNLKKGDAFLVVPIRSIFKK